MPWERRVAYGGGEHDCDEDGVLGGSLGGASSDELEVVQTRCFAVES